VLEPEDVRRLVRLARVGPLVTDGARVAIDAGGLQRLLPHRPPMLLVDGIDTIDLETRGVRGHRVLRDDDLGFAGHFPDGPIYPGVLSIEAMGQLGLTLAHFVGAQRVDVPDGPVPARVRAIHVHHASFLSAFRPGDTMTLHARVAHDDYTMVVLGQAWNGNTLAAFSISEVLVDA
jgi:3-hydroxymyristoyl/3-hydroxydecanoyl-(acyl carrier protein) dehydratase